MKEPVVIKSYQINGLKFVMDPSVPFEDILSCLAGRLEKSRKFFKDIPKGLLFEGRELSMEEQEKILECIRENSDINIVCIMEENEELQKKINEEVMKACLELEKRKLEAGLLDNLPKEAVEGKQIFEDSQKTRKKQEKTSDEALNIKTSSGEILSDKTSSGEMSDDETLSNKTSNDKISNDKTSGNETLGDEISSDKTSNGKTLDNKTLGKTSNDRTLSDRASNDKTSSSKTLNGKISKKSKFEHNQEKRNIKEQVSKQMAEDPGLFYKGNLRSGQVLESDKSIIFLGDIKPGAHVISKGNVIVLGSLRGNVFAGSAGNKKAFVVALDMQPVQVRIDDFIARSPDEPEQEKEKQAKIAFLEGENIYIEPISREVFHDIQV